jgi:gamma-glutamylcyclotransferase (GGCT)/AIG2-like uncharacterized protein YtfP
MLPEPSHLRVFVYGTLKQGGRNHPAYCRGILAVEPARVLGQLYDLPAGYPMLVVPGTAVLAIGSSNYLHDAIRQDDDQRPPACAASAADDWQEIYGELLSFDDPLARLPALDGLEDFRPGETSLYARVLVRLLEPAGITAWTYVAPDGRLPPGARRCGSVW